MNKINVILGTDWWTDSDDVVAMRVMAYMHKKGVINFRGVALNACMEASAASLSAFLQNEGINIPIGLDTDATDFGAKAAMYQPNMAKNPHYMTNSECEDAVKLYRRILTETEEMFDIIEIGYPQVLAALLKSSGDEFSSLPGIELVKNKVNKLWIMAGNWEKETGMENNFIRNNRSRQGGSYLCQNWPTPITFLGWEVGSTVITGSKFLDKTDMVYRAMDDIGFGKGRSSWDPMLCLMACIHDEEKAGYTTIRGTASVCPETGENRFEKTDAGLHCYVVKKFPDEYYSNAIDEIIYHTV